MLFAENETNNERIFGTPHTSPYLKDGINNYVVSKDQAAINPQRTGTKASAHYQIVVDAGKMASRSSCAWFADWIAPPGALTLDLARGQCDNATGDAKNHNGRGEDLKH